MIINIDTPSRSNGGENIVSPGFPLYHPSHRSGQAFRGVLETKSLVIIFLASFFFMKNTTTASSAFPYAAQDEAFGGTSNEAKFVIINILGSLCWIALQRFCITFLSIIHYRTMGGRGKSWWWRATTICKEAGFTYTLETRSWNVPYSPQVPKELLISEGARWRTRQQPTGHLAVSIAQEDYHFE